MGTAMTAVDPAQALTATEIILTAVTGLSLRSHLVAVRRRQL